MSPNFSLIIPNYNGLPFLVDCLLSITRAIKHCPLSKFEIILVDNGSTDSSLDIFKEIFRPFIIKNLKFKIIRLKANCGFAKPVNLGIQASKYDYVCLLNNDLILEKNWFLLLSKVIVAHPQTTGFCGTVLNRDGTKIESQGLRYFMSGRCENINNNLPYLKIKNLKLKIFPVWGSSGAAIVYKKEDIQKIGLFDESFFAYIEDVDLSYRLNKHKFTTLLVSRAIVYHLGGGTSNRMGTLRQYYTLRNWIKLIIKNYSPPEIITNLPGIILERFRNLSYLLKSIIYSAIFKWC
jgi:GT2 family glycosyltransferase